MRLARTPLYRSINGNSNMINAGDLVDTNFMYFYAFSPNPSTVTLCYAQGTTAQSFILFCDVGGMGHAGPCKAKRLLLLVKRWTRKDTQVRQRFSPASHRPFCPSPVAVAGFCFSDCLRHLLIGQTSPRSAVYPDGRVCISILHPPGEDKFNEQVGAEQGTSPPPSYENINKYVNS